MNMNKLTKQLKLKNVEYAAFASQETHCFSADVYYKGKHVFRASNSGHGGPDDQHVVNQELADEILEQCDVIAKENGVSGSKWFALECVTGELLEEYLTVKDLKRLMSRKVIWLSKDGNVYQTKNARNAEVRNNWAEQIAEREDTESVLNLLPINEALTIYRNIGAQ
jgi:hypothetical protein